VRGKRKKKRRRTGEKKKMDKENGHRKRSTKGKVAIERVQMGRSNDKKRKEKGKSYRI
jgi:hypothetical protein